ncbi:MAG: hypothetical protein IT376_16040 [Polyangiaceae bacterium]|nr:hypothetical protein [Polyangiaceae bacterium]
MVRRALAVGVLVGGASLVATACGGEDDDLAGSDPANGTGGSGSDGGAGAGGAGGASGASGAAGAAGAGGGLAGMRCGGTPPPGAPAPAAPRAYSAGTCPTLPTTTTADIAFTSGGNARAFTLALPADFQKGEQLPLVFLWHWLGGDANGFYERGEVQAAVDSQRFIAVIPTEKDDLLFTWPYSLIDSEARLQEELTFFDDLHACVLEQVGGDPACVSSIGVSAVALFTDQLAPRRADVLANFVSLSGGVGGVIKPWTPALRPLPGLVLWGGPTDDCIGLLKFEVGSRALEDALIAGGHFFVECVHNCGHAVPPFEAPTSFSKFKGMWDFVFDHPFWLPAGQSPYQETGVPADLPAWCGIGQGGATPREGTCEDPSEC